MRRVAAGAAIGAGGVLVAVLCAIGTALAAAFADDLDEDDDPLAPEISAFP